MLTGKAICVPMYSKTIEDLIQARVPASHGRFLLRWRQEVASGKLDVVPGRGLGRLPLHRVSSNRLSLCLQRDTVRCLARVPVGSLESEGCLRGSQLCSKNGFNMCEFDYVTRFKLLLATLDHNVIHPYRYLVFGSSYEVAIFGSVDQGCNAGSKPAF